jgi:hypothetical protein
MPAPALETTGLDPRTVKERAKSIFRETFHYPGIAFRSIGRECFAWALRSARFELEHGTAAERAERAAQTEAARYGFNIDALEFECARRRFGSFTTTLEGSLERLAVFRRAWAIAWDRKSLIKTAEKEIA